MRRFASVDDFGRKTISEFDATRFNAWFENTGRAQIMGSPATNSEIMGAMLFCGNASASDAMPKAGEDLYGKNPCVLPIKEDKLLLVVHPNYFGQNSGASGNIEREMKKAKGSGVQSVVLLEPKREFSEGSKSPDGYINDHDPTMYVGSHNGEHNIELSSDKAEVTMVSGYFDRCFQRAMMHLIRHFKGEELTIRIPSDAVFNRNDDSPNPLLKGDIRGKGRASMEERLDFFMRLAMRKGDFVKEVIGEPADPEASVIDWDRFHFQNTSNSSAEENAPSNQDSAEEVATPDLQDEVISVAPEDVASGKDGVCEKDSPRYMLNDNLTDFGLVFKDKDGVFFSRNCREGKPTVTIVFE